MPKRFTPREISEEEKSAAVTRLLSSYWDAAADFVNETKTAATRPVPAWHHLDGRSQQMFSTAFAEIGVYTALSKLTGAITADHERRRN